MAHPSEKNHILHTLYFQVIVGVLFGVAVGLLWPEFGTKLKPLGDGFIKLIKMLIAPIIFLTVSLGIAHTGDMRKVGRVGLKALLYFEVVSSLALLIGLIVVNLWKPGEGMNIDPKTLDAGAVSSYSAGAKSLSTVDFLLNIIPTSVVDAFAKSEILQVLLFSVLFGWAMGRQDVRGRPRSSCGNTWRKACRRLDVGAHRIRCNSQQIKRNRHKTWHYIFDSAYPRLKSYQ